MKAQVAFSFLVDFRMKQQRWTEVDKKCCLLLYEGLFVALALNFQECGVVFMVKVSIKQMALCQIYFKVMYWK